MALIADILLVAASLAAAFYCLILSRRLSRFTDLEKGVGGAVAVLSVQVDEMTRAVADARSAAGQSAESLSELVVRAEDARRGLELLMASMHDLPTEAAEPQKAPAPARTQSPTRTVRRSRRERTGEPA
ncbi:DUF6468 domain-containing protein [Roseicyclus sp. F158]|uniref:DUF6468 domain-containing protein n=1 Tax=Tropicimonas omnivorans TaxID=3075590 RepID=A0ABU3DD99_9RHOB|nr:DUF6468 domain-containing protein [Roseicyclus sp. F158]MDT0681676.1 DUF6468 domain-containing protein [Roseicyclus sp. F158]